MKLTPAYAAAARANLRANVNRAALLGDAAFNLTAPDGAPVRGFCRGYIAGMVVTVAEGATMLAFDPHTLTTADGWAITRAW